MSSLDLQDVGRDFSFSLCAAPLSDSCPKILEQGDWKIGVSIGVVLRVEPREQVTEVRTYSIFELKYLHGKSKVFIQSNGINKKINQRTNNKQSL